MKHIAYAPASIGNVSLGFDVLGAALAPVDGSKLGDTVEFVAADTFSLSVTGAFADKLPGDTDSNIVTHCYRYFIDKLSASGKTVSPCAITLSKNLPIGSGLGSSASSVVAALHGLNDFYGEPFDETELLFIMGELEGQISGSVHYDNVAPCYLGGLTLMVESNGQIATKLPVIDDWYWVVCYSGISVSTAAARKILPESIPMKTGLTFGRQLAAFVDALYRQDAILAASVMNDVIAEPYRKSLLPKFDEARDFATANGGLAFGISGSGPTVFAVTNSLAEAETISQWLSDNYIQNEDGFSKVCKIDSHGSSVEREN